MIGVNSIEAYVILGGFLNFGIAMVVTAIYWCIEDGNKC
jgi:hypothetical protein